MEVCCGASQCTVALQVLVIQCELLRQAIVILTSGGDSVGLVYLHTEDLWHS